MSRMRLWGRGIASKLLWRGSGFLAGVLGFCNGFLALLSTGKLVILIIRLYISFALVTVE